MREVSERREWNPLSNSQSKTASGGAVGIEEAIEESLERAKRLYQRLGAIFLLSGFLDVLIQVLRLGAFLIPIKILYLASATSVPGYIGVVFPEQDKEYVVFWLSVITAILFLASAAADWLSRRVVQCAVRRLKSGENEVSELSLSRLYRNGVQFSASVFFGLALLPIVLYVIPGSVWLVTTAVILIVAAIFCLRGDLTDARLAAGRLQAATFINSSCFFLGFALLLSDVLAQAHESSVLVAIVALMILRLCLVQFLVVGRQLIQYPSSTQLVRHLLPGSAISESAVSPVMPVVVEGGLFSGEITSCDSESVIIGNALSEIGLKKHGRRVLPVDAGRFDCWAAIVKDEENTAALLKFYGARAQALAIAERKFAYRNQSAKVAPALLGTVSLLDAAEINLFENVSPLSREQGVARREEFLGLCSSIDPVDSWLDSAAKPPIHERFHPGLTALMAVGRAPKQWGGLDESWGRVQRLLEHMPRWVVTRSEPGSLAILNGGLVGMHWEQWSVEPVGVTWAGESIPLDLLQRALSTSSRTDVRNTSAHLTKMAWLVARLEVSIARSDYALGSQLVSSLLASLEAYDHESAF